MLLLFRFLISILGSSFRRRIGPFDAAVVRFTVLPNDCDLNIHLNAGRFVSFMDIARVELIARMRLLRPVLKRGWRPVVGGLVIRYRRSVLPFERFRITSRVLGWDDKWIYIEHILDRHDGSLAAIGHSRTLFRTKTGTVPPSEILALMNMPGQQSPALPDFVVQWRDAEDGR
jgi:acyl-CoA thioesterase FadM